jgi:hypothetical protein
VINIHVLSNGLPSERHSRVEFLQGFLSYTCRRAAVQKGSATAKILQLKRNLQRMALGWREEGL